MDLYLLWAPSAHFRAAGSCVLTERARASLQNEAADTHADKQAPSIGQTGSVSREPPTEAHGKTGWKMHSGVLGLTGQQAREYRINSNRWAFPLASRLFITMINRLWYLSNRTIYNPMLRGFFLFFFYQDDELWMNQLAAFPPSPSLCIRFLSFQVKYFSLSFSKSDSCHSDNQVSWREGEKSRLLSLSHVYTQISSRASQTLF